MPHLQALLQTQPEGEGDHASASCTGTASGTGEELRLVQRLLEKDALQARGPEAALAVRVNPFSEV